MFSRFQLAKKYFQYYCNSLNSKGHGIHSPFVFDFVKHVLNDSSEYGAYQKIESVRTQMLQDQRILEVQDMGAGSVISKTKMRKVSEISRSALKPKKYGQLLYRMVKYYQPQTIIELGTSLGITTSYLALANPLATVITLEGASTVAAVAKDNFNTLGIKNTRLEEGNFDETLSKLLLRISIADFVFVDGNHRKLPTLDYFHVLLPKINTSSILIFDDIHWSHEMEEAWELIKAHPAVTLTIDLFFIGIVLFRNDFKVKQHFVIKF